MLALVPLKDLDHISFSWLLNCVCVSIPKCNRHISVDFIASIYIFFNYFYTYIFMCVCVCVCAIRTMYRGQWTTLDYRFFASTVWVLLIKVTIITHYLYPLSHLA